MEVKATARYIRMSPRKVRLVIGVIRGMDIESARAQLHIMKKAAALPVAKLLESAVANASHNFHLPLATMYVKNITADGGPVLGRWRARAFGRSAPIRKRTTHMSIVLDSRATKASAADKLN